MQNKSNIFPVLIAISFRVSDPKDIPEIIEAIHPPSLPSFAGEIRVVVGTDVDDVIKFLDEEE